MGLFGRKRPLHERLADEGGLDFAREPDRTPSRIAGLFHGLVDGFLTAPPDMFGKPTPLGEVGIHGVPRARRWDAVASVRADDLPGDQVEFAALADGTLIVDADVPDGSLAPLAEAIEGTLTPPYRAEAVRRGGGIWAVAANRIQLREFPETDGDTVELIEGETIVLGRRLDGDLFEVEVTPL